MDRWTLFRRIASIEWEVGKEDVDHLHNWFSFINNICQRISAYYVDKVVEEMVPIAKWGTPNVPCIDLTIGQWCSLSIWNKVIGFSPDSGVNATRIWISNSPQPVSVTSNGGLSITCQVRTSELVQAKTVLLTSAGTCKTFVQFECDSLDEMTKIVFSAHYIRLSLYE